MVEFKSIYKKIVNHFKVYNSELFFIMKEIALKIDQIKLKLIDDETFLKWQYYRKTGQKLNLENPVTYNEKIQWLKLNYRNPLLNRCVDKYAVRNYVLEKTNRPEILIPIYGVYNNIDEVNFNELPDKFDLKLTNGSGFNYVCKNKTKKEIKKIKRRFRSWIKINYYARGREWAYKNVKNRIICEELLEPKNGEFLKDYKFFCFNGKVKIIFVNIDNVGNGLKTNSYRNLYTPDWKLISGKIGFPNYPYDIPKPQKLDEMIEIAELLSKDFPTVRVDLYYFDEKIYFGELTFYHSSGYQKIEPDELSKRMGDWITVIN